MRSRSLPRITTPVPCSADWNAMRPIESDGRARLCGACDKPVYDARSMTRGELARLILTHEGALPCLRLLRRPDGTIVTKGCYAHLLRAGRFLRLRIGLAAVAFWSTVFAFWSWTRRPAPSLIDSADATGTEPRRLSFVVKPFERPDVRPSHARAHKPRARPAPPEEQVIEFLGEIAIDDP